MALRTRLTELFGIEHPIVLAPMGGVAGGALAAAVSEGGGLGLVGGGSGDTKWMAHQCVIAQVSTTQPWGIGLLSWAIDARTIDWALQQDPAAILLGFGDPTPFAETVKSAGVPLLVQVTDMDDARRALDAGADVVVAQGSEAGGHGGGRATLPFVPAVVDIAGSVPVLAAGGIADGRGLAAALALGAAGAMIGTRFEATRQALTTTEEGDAIAAATAESTVRNRVIDIAADAAWPAEYSARTLGNRFIDEWKDDESGLESDSTARQRYQTGLKNGDPDYLTVWAGEAVDLITAIEDADMLVGRIAADAERAIDGLRAGTSGG